MSAALISAASTGQYPSPIAAVFYEDSHNLQSPSEPYCSCVITRHITINLSEEEVRDPEELPPTTQRNRGSNAEGAGKDERNKQTQQSTRLATQQYTHLGGGGKSVG